MVQRAVRGLCVAFRHANPVQVELPCNRTFCPACGTQLSFVDDATPEATDVTSGSLDEPNRVAPRDHTYTASKLDWLAISDGLPQYRRSRSEG